MYHFVLFKLPYEDGATDSFDLTIWTEGIDVGRNFWLLPNSWRILLAERSLRDKLLKHYVNAAET